MRSYLKVRKNEFCEQKLKNIREKKTKNCEKFPLFRAFKKQTKQKVKEMSENAIFFHAAIFFAIIVNSHCLYLNLNGKRCRRSF